MSTELSEMVEPREVLDWETFGHAMRQLAQQVVDSGWIPDLVVAVARGGLLPAGAISYAMGVKAIGTMNIEFYTDIAETLPEPVLLPPMMDISAMDGKRVLVVDDVADSGKTLKMVMDMISRRSFAGFGDMTKPVDARCAVIYHKTRSVIVPDYWWKHTDLWIDFPWSVLPPVERSLPSESDSDKGAND